MTRFRKQNGLWFKGPLYRFKAAGFRKPRRGEVVVFVPPQEKSNPFWKRKVYIKRLIAAGGERVLIKDGNIYINGKIIADPVIARVIITIAAIMVKKIRK